MIFCRLIFLLIFSFLQVSSSGAQEIAKTLLRGYDTAFVLYDRSSGAMVDPDPVLSARRLSPCSTFKIYNTLIGLELGLIKGADAPWYRWDGVQRSIEGWNKDLSLREAFRVSAVPAYQILARQIGLERMKTYLDRIGYGTGEIGSGIDVFWLDRKGVSSIAVSAQEQVGLLNRLLDGKLPFSPGNVAVLKDIMMAMKTERGTLFGKTGSGAGLGWYVGFVEHGGTTYVFACNITGGKDPSGKVARSIAEDILVSLGLL